MKWYWKALIGLGSLVLLVVILEIGVNLWIKHQLPKIINRENDSAYHISYKNLEVSLLKHQIIAEDIVIVPKTALLDSLNKTGIYAKVHSVKINKFKTWDLLFNDKIKAKSVTVERPKVILYTKDKRERIRESVVAPFNKIISVSDVFLNHGDLKIIQVKNNKAVLSVQNINLQLDGILITEKTLKDKIPFEYKNYALSCDSLYYHPNEFYHLSTKKINVSKTDLAIADFKMLPTYSRREFVSKIDKEKDLYTLSCKAIKMDKINWGFKEEDFFFHCNTIDLNQAAANIYRSLEPIDDQSKRKFYNTMLRELKFELKIDTLKLRNSILEYEEEKSFAVGSAKLIFNSFNLTATSINSGFKKTSLPDLKIKVDCKFMNDSPLKVNWKLNVMDKSDGFNIAGTLTNFDAEKITPFTKPYLNMTTEGILDVVRFNFTGNDSGSKGEFKVEYDDLKFTFYKNEDRKKKSKLKTFFAGLLVKKDSNDKLKSAHVQVVRIREKSFYNLLWRSIQEGLKKILI